jgi:hypothetical protein
MAQRCSPTLRVRAVPSTCCISVRSHRISSRWSWDRSGAIHVSGSRPSPSHSYRPSRQVSRPMGRCVLESETSFTRLCPNLRERTDGSRPAGVSRTWPHQTRPSVAEAKRAHILRWTARRLWSANQSSRIEEVSFGSISLFEPGTLHVGFTPDPDVSLRRRNEGNGQQPVHSSKQRGVRAKSSRSA